MIKNVDGFEYPDDAPNPGTCDAGCGKPATWWFGLTNYAYCGDGECLTVMKARYQKPLGPCVGTLDEAQYAESHLANLQQANTALHRVLESLVDAAVTRDIQLHDALARIVTLEAAVRENHAWHQLYDEHNGYAGSALEQTNLAALKK
jgi:hypothetical protein